MLHDYKNDYKSVKRPMSALENENPDCSFLQKEARHLLGGSISFVKTVRSKEPKDDWRGIVDRGCADVRLKYFSVRETLAYED